MNKYKLEIEYQYAPVAGETPRIHWMYFGCEAQSVKSAMTKAEAHYRSQMAALGWAKYTTLTEIRPPKKANDPMHSRPNSDLSASRKSGGSDLKPKRRTTRRKSTPAKSGKPAASSKRKKST